MSLWTLAVFPLWGGLMGYWIGLSLIYFGGHGHDHD